MRGLAALYVVLYHFCGKPAAEDSFLPAALKAALLPLRYGHYAVVVFIVLSGFCLALPVALTPDLSLRGGIGRYLQRRARRILPPYWAALALSIALIAVSSLVLKRLGHLPPELAPDQLISHALLIHNFRLDWVQTINPPLWSVAVEWQIYFFLPLVLLPIWRRFGPGAAALASVLLGIAPHFLLPAGANFDWSLPWMLGLFGLGLLAAAVSVADGDAAARRRAIASRLFVPLALASAVALLLWPKTDFSRLWAMDLLVGAATGSLLVGCAQEEAQGRRGWLRRLLEARPSVALGRFSYSLYLIHFPALWLLLPVSKKLPPIGQWAFESTIGVAWAVGIAYLFHRVVERRFLTPPPR